MRCATLLAVTSLLGAGAPWVAAAAPAVYPAPAGITPSTDYAVTVTQTGVTQSSFTYQNISDDSADDHIEAEVMKGIAANPALTRHYTGSDQPPAPTRRRSVSYTTFSAEGPVTVQVRGLKTPILSAAILPTARGIAGRVANGVLSFDLAEPAKLAIVINGNYLDPLFLFADAPEMDVPQVGTPGVLSIKPGTDSRAAPAALAAARVIRFEPGLHDIGIAFPVSAGQTVYLAGGSYLRGTFHGYMASHVTFRGRGILSGELIPRAHIQELKRRDGTMWERLQLHSINMLSAQNRTSWNAYAPRAGLGCDHLTIEGITLVDPGHFFLRLTGNPITIHNVKMVGGWHFNSDGVSTIGQANTTVYDCFFHCNDDAIYVRPDNVHIHHCTFWQSNNGAVFQFSWGGDPYDQGGGYIHDIDIVHCDHVREANNRAIFGSRKSGPGDIRNILFKDIRIEGPVWRLFRLNTDASNLARGAPGSIYDITFENISVTGPVLHPSEIIANEGAPTDAGPLPGRLHDFKFKNVTINGHPMTRADFILGEKGVTNIQFNSAP